MYKTINMYTILSDYTRKVESLSVLLQLTKENNKTLRKKMHFATPKKQSCKIKYSL